MFDKGGIRHTQEETILLATTHVATCVVLVFIDESKEDSRLIRCLYHYDGIELMDLEDHVIKMKSQVKYQFLRMWVIGGYEDAKTSPHFKKI